MYYSPDPLLLPSWGTTREPSAPNYHIELLFKSRCLSAPKSDATGSARRRRGDDPRSRFHHAVRTPGKQADGEDLITVGKRRFISCTCSVFVTVGDSRRPSWRHRVPLVPLGGGSNLPAPLRGVLSRHRVPPASLGGVLAPDTDPVLVGSGGMVSGGSSPGDPHGGSLDL